MITAGLAHKSYPTFYETVKFVSNLELRASDLVAAMPRCDLRVSTDPRP